MATHEKLVGLANASRIEITVGRAIIEGYRLDDAASHAVQHLTADERYRLANVAEYVEEQYALNHLDSRGVHEDYRD